MTQWFHYSKDPMTQILARQQMPEPFHKPKGLWVSDESDHGWREWCEDNDFQLDTLKYRHEIELTDGARLLRLKCESDLRAFTRQYKDAFFAEIGIRMIRWDAVAEDYQGILITPYQWRMRLEMDTGWYYTWDCASGCIWDPAAAVIHRVEVMERDDGAEEMRA